jgi:hypothetical protein
MKSRFVLQPNRGTCQVCKGDLFAQGQPCQCPYLRRLVDEFVGAKRWERVRFRVDKDQVTTVCSMRLQAIEKDAGIVTLDLVYKTVHTTYAKTCVLEANVQGGSELKILDSVGNIVRHNLPL